MSKLNKKGYSGKFLTEFTESLKSTEPDSTDILDQNEKIKIPQSYEAKIPIKDLVKYNNPAEAAQDIVKYLPNMKAGHCWDWVEKIYNAAGFDRKGIYQDLNYEGKDAGSHRAGPNLLDQIQPGDWLFINNKNQSDTHGNHSVIFLGWKTPNQIANVASYYDNAGHIHSYDINKYPVTAISKPIPKSGNPSPQSESIINALTAAKSGNQEVADNIIKSLKALNKIDNLLKLSYYFEKITKY